MASRAVKLKSPRSFSADEFGVIVFQFAGPSGQCHPLTDGGDGAAAVMRILP